MSAAEAPTGGMTATEAAAGKARRRRRQIVDRLIDRAPDHLNPGGVLLVVHSSVNGVDPSLDRIEAGGMEPDLAATHRGPLGPILTERARIMEERGLIEPGQREEDVVIVRGRVPVATI